MPGIPPTGGPNFGGLLLDEGLTRAITNTVEEQVPTVRRIIEVLDATLLFDKLRSIGALRRPE